MMQNNLGLAFAAFGAQERSTSRLEEAVAAYHGALQEGTRDRTPLQWAAIRHNLGVALLTLGERDGDIARLKEAAAAFRDALQERTRARAPVDWATTQSDRSS
jgi:tetratricopeptide (TPR) repeat protein